MIFNIHYNIIYILLLSIDKNYFFNLSSFFLIINIDNTFKFNLKIFYYLFIMNNNSKQINQIINKLYLDLDNYEELLVVNNFEEFYNYIYSINNSRHHNFYKENNIELLNEYKNYENIINKSIQIFDKQFNYYLKKLEPEILKYYVLIYYNSKNNDLEYEKEKDDEFIKMLKGLRKMCICLVKQEINSLKFNEYDIKI